MSKHVREVPNFNLLIVNKIRQHIRYFSSSFFFFFFFFFFTIAKIHLFQYIENFTTENCNFRIKILIFFHISAENIDCGYSLEPPRRGGSNEYPQSMFFSSNKKNNIYPCEPSFTI